MSAGEAIAMVLLAHLCGDYLLQTHWMATQKVTRWWPAIVHGSVYTLPYLLITTSWVALLVIAGTHAVIDRYRLAKHLVWAKDKIAPRGHRGTAHVGTTGNDDAPVWLSTWLMIVADNTTHVLIGVGAVLWL